MNEEKFLNCPDDSGWFFFKKGNKTSETMVVRLRDDGRAFVLDEYGDSFELDDLIGVWEPIEDPQI